ncbi:MAG UNVERIFIED_CONTAM: hypothetical protein LVR29_02905 [Microcystis novacekii LVE1205-3]
MALFLSSLPALCPLNSDQKRKTPLFLDIYASGQPASNQQGIPVYCWSKKPSERACLYLFLANGNSFLSDRGHFLSITRGNNLLGNCFAQF